jgi:hypothetical protein
MSSSGRLPTAAAVWLACNLVLVSNGFAACSGVTRFTVHGGGAFDPRTGLTWKRCSEGLTWAKGACVGQSGFFRLDDARKLTGEGWRMPTIQELSRLLDRNCKDPAIDTKAFPDVKANDEGDSTYWTVSEMGMLNLTYTVDFMNGIIDGHSPGIRYAVRLVREGRH